MAAEQGGFDSIWVPDHVHQNQTGGGPASPMLEAYTLLGALAVRTQQVKLGALVTPVTLRNPAVLAKTVTTLDVLSGGRAVLGIGAGWDVGEHTAYGVAFPPADERWDRLEEGIEICQKLFGEQQVEYKGRYYSVEGAWNSPRPVQPRIPLLIGGGGETRTLPLVARYADACNLLGDAPAIVRKLKVLKRQCERVGRDYSTIAKTSVIFAPESPQELCRLVAAQLEAGLDGIVLLAHTCPSPAAIRAWGTALQQSFG